MTVVEQRPTPGGRAAQLRDAGFTWDTGPSLITMPWVLEETFAAGGLDLHSRGRRCGGSIRFYRIRWAGEERAPRLRRRPRAAARARSRKFSRARRRARSTASWRRCKPIYEEGILAAGPPAFPSRAAISPRSCRRMVAPRRARCRCSTFVARHFAPPARARGVLVPLAVHRRRPVPRAGDLRRARLPAGARRRLVRRRRRVRARRGDGAAARRALRRARRSAIEHRGRPRDRRRGSRAASASPADVVVSNADVLRTHELLGRRAPRRRLRPTMSVLPALPRHATGASTRCCTTRCSSGRGYRDFIRDVTRGRGLPRDVLDLRARAGAHGAGDGARPAATRSRVLLPVPNLRARDRLGPRRRTGCATRSSRDLETTFGLDGLRRVDRGRAPDDAAGLRDASSAPWTATRSRSSRRCTSRAYFRPPNRDRAACAGSTTSAAGRTRAPGIPGVLLGRASVDRRARARAPDRSAAPCCARS